MLCLSLIQIPTGLDLQGKQHLGNDIWLIQSTHRSYCGLWVSQNCAKFQFFYLSILTNKNIQHNIKQKCFFRQFFHSVAKVDYFTLRHGFISVSTHINAYFCFLNRKECIIVNLFILRIKLVGSSSIDEQHFQFPQVHTTFLRRWLQSCSWHKVKCNLHSIIGVLT